MSYEYLYPKVERLREKPFKADEIMRTVEEAGFKPIQLKVDNVLGQVVAYFEGELGKKKKKALDELFSNLFKKW